MRNRILFLFWRGLFQLLDWIRIWAWRAIRFGFDMFLCAGMSLWVGVPEATQWLAYRWMARAVGPFMTSQRIVDTFNWFFRGMASLGIVIGWVMLSHAIVWGLWYLTQMLK